MSTRSLTHLAELLRAQRVSKGTRYRRLDPGRQALLVLAHPRNGDTPARPAGGFAIGATTAWRHIREAVDLLATQAPTLEQAMHRIAHLAYAILDGTSIRTDRLSGEQDRRHYAGKHRCHGVNAQIIANAAGRLARISPWLPGSTHDLTAARAHGVIDALTTPDVMTFADKGYRGARGTIVVPFYGRNLPEPMREVNRSHAKIRAIGETRHRHPQHLETPGQAALLPTPGHRTPRRDLRPSTHRGAALLSLKTAHWITALAAGHLAPTTWLAGRRRGQGNCREPGE